MISYQIKVKKFTIKNFRKFSLLDIDFPESSLAILAGRNATGKTSILEALNIALTEKNSRFTDVVESDFYNEDPIILDVTFDKPFFFEIQYTSSGHLGLVPCYGLVKTIDRRRKKETGKFFSSEYDVRVDYKITNFNPPKVEFDQLKRDIDAFKPSINHHLIREFTIDEDGICSYKKITDLVSTPPTRLEYGIEAFRYNTFPKVLYPIVFYYDNNRTRDLLPQYNTIYSNIIAEMNWRFKRELLKSANVLKKNELFATFEDFHTRLDKIEPYQKELTEPSIERLQTDFGIDLGKDLKMFSTNIYQPYTNSWFGKITDENQSVSALQFGSGISMLLALSMSLSFADVAKVPIIILIDEPELHLHSDLQKKLFLMFKNSIFQAIVSTHSHLFLDKIDFKNNLLLECLDDGDTQIKVTSRIDLADLQFRLLGNSISDLYIPERILVVEGKHDRILILKCLDLLGHSSLNIQIVDAGGKDNIPDKSDRYNEVLKEILVSGKWYSAALIKVLKIVVDGDVSPGKVTAWSTTYGFNIATQIKQLETTNNLCMEHYLPETLVRECIKDTLLDKKVFLSSKSIKEIIDIILSDDKIKEKDKEKKCQQKENRISKARLNEYVINHLEKAHLDSPLNLNLKEVINWVVL